LTEEVVEVSASDYDKTGGGTGQEFPWKLLYNNQGPGDKWISHNGEGRGWILYQFKRPLLIRGYGLKSANDEPGRDPKSFSLYVYDVFDPRPKDQKDFIEAHKAVNQKFIKRWQTNIYHLQRTYVVHAVKLVVHEHH
jgi:hypothetical protein